MLYNLYLQLFEINNELLTAFNWLNIDFLFSCSLSHVRSFVFLFWYVYFYHFPLSLCYVSRGENGEKDFFFSKSSIHSFIFISHPVQFVLEHQFTMNEWDIWASTQKCSNMNFKNIFAFFFFHSHFHFNLILAFRSNKIECRQAEKFSASIKILGLIVSVSEAKTITMSDYDKW